MPFHRLTSASYFGAPLFDKLNDPVGGGSGVGIATPADTGAKVGGVYDGVYFLAGQETLTSFNINRGMHALAENTDFLDDVVHGDLVTITFASALSAGDASITVSGAVTNVFVGNGGESAASLFVLINDNLSPIYDPATGNRIVVASITGATLGTGFSAANPITLNFSATVPNGVTYIIIYGERGSLATQPNNIVSSFMPALATTPVPVGDIIRGGLDARYRNATTASAAILNTAGAGGIITRDGPAPAVDADDSTNLFYDPIGACWKAFSSENAGGTFPVGRTTGLGFVHYVSDRFGNEVEEEGPAPSIGSFASVWPHDHVGTFAGINPRTQVNPTRVAALNPGGAGATLVQLHAADFFFDGSNESAVNVGYDLLEIIRASGAVEVYCITQLITGNARRCTVATLTGASPVFPSDEVVTVRWITTKFWQGPSVGYKWQQEIGGVEPVLLGAMVVQPSVYVSSNDYDDLPPTFGAISTAKAASALRWAGFDYAVVSTSGHSGIQNRFISVALYGALNGDGSISAAKRSDFGLLQRRTDYRTVGGGGPTNVFLTPHNYSQAEVLFLDGANAVTVDLTTNGYIAAPGDELIFIFTQDGSVGNNTVTWPGNCVFSGGDAAISTGVNAKSLYLGVVDNAGNILMTKTVY